MATTVTHLKAQLGDDAPVSRATRDAPWVRWSLTAVALLFLAGFLLLPLAAVFTEALRKGLGV